MKRALFVLLITSMFLNFAIGLFGPLYAAFVREIGGNLVTAGTAFSVFSIASGAAIFFISRWEDHVKHQEKLLVLGRALTAIAVLGYLFVNNIAQLYIVQGLLGIALAVNGPVYQSLYSKNLDKGKFASEWGLWSSSHGIVMGLSAIGGGIVAQNYGFDILFVLMFIVAVLALIASLFLLKKGIKHLFD
jgi:sugar phosphate permease